MPAPAESLPRGGTPPHRVLNVPEASLTGLVHGGNDGIHRGHRACGTGRLDSLRYLCSQCSLTPLALSVAADRYCFKVVDQHSSRRVCSCDCPRHRDHVLSRFLILFLGCTPPRPNHIGPAVRRAIGRSSVLLLRHQTGFLTNSDVVTESPSQDRLASRPHLLNRACVQTPPDSRRPPSYRTGEVCVLLVPHA